MGVEAYQYLIAHAAELGLNPAHIGPASADLCLGGIIEILGRITGDGTIAKAEYQLLGDEYFLFPGRFYLASTIETIYVPPTHSAMIMMRSSWARRGMGHRFAGWVDAGFRGQVTLELDTLVPLRVPKGERIVQIIYERLTEPTERPYAGRYLGQTGPTPAYEVR